jgi:proteasome lid subunit RPN8/RPN11
MNGPYPQIDRWVLPTGALLATLRSVQEEGQGVREAGALWLGSRENTARVRAVLFPSGKGVEATAGKWKVSPEVFGVVTRWAKPQGLSLLAVVHTHLHGVPPRLSRADREYSVQVPGMLAAVIGEGGHEGDHGNWGWYVYEKNDYRQILNEELKQRVEMSSEKVDVQRVNSEEIWEVGQE